MAQGRFRPGVTCGLSLMLVFAFLRVFSSSFSDFPPSTKTNICKFQFNRDREPAWQQAQAYETSSRNIVNFSIFTCRLNVDVTGVTMCLFLFSRTKMNCPRSKTTWIKSGSLDSRLWSEYRTKRGLGSKDESRRLFMSTGNWRRKCGQRRRLVHAQ